MKTIINIVRQQSYSNPNMSGYVYLVVQREFLRSGENVAKCGRASDWLKRFKQYPKGSKLLYAVYCNDMVEAEKDALSLLGKLFKQRRDIGTESFEGDIASMIAAINKLFTITTVANGPVCMCQEPDDGGAATMADNATTATGATTDDGDTTVEETETLPPTKVLVNKTIAIGRFVNSLGSRDGMSISSMDLYGQYLDFVNDPAHDWTAPIVDHHPFTKIIVHNYGAVSDVVRVGASTHRCILFPLPPPPEEEEPAETVLDADNRNPYAAAFIAHHVDFAPRRSPTYAGKKYYAWIPEKDLTARFWEWHTSGATDNVDYRRNMNKEQDKKSVWKDVLHDAMGNKGRRVAEIHPCIDGLQRNVLAYNMCAWRELIEC